ncbi:Endonuclease/exonuclease/phosphatase [Corchorus olitorius]|uniref:Endonuclease/exonuclease/phosphatase n=1 Tax=Corchorus olitorius TaxID=93759 RepID=A0A1R3IVZ1_9ROSI|nr:Endonuclease/exonuclease/phosphatase [Corchorus olitorius]
MEEGHSDTNSEDGRRICQRLQSLDVNEMVAVMERQSQVALVIRNNDNNELGLRQVVPQQPPGRHDLAEIPNKGLHFTWSNRRDPGQWTWERLDRAFANANWFQKFGNAVLTNLPITASDHSPLLLQFDKQDGFRRRPYRFEMMWSTNEQCEKVIKESWNQEVVGSNAFKLVQKIKITRDELRTWNKTEFGNIFQRKQARGKELEEIQTNIDKTENQMKEPLKRKELEELLEQEQIMWMQKSKNKLDSARGQEY